MTAHQLIESDLVAEHRRATAEVNRWRGRCVDCFARIELSVIETLDVMIASKRIAALKRTSMFKQHIDMMNLALRDKAFGKHVRLSQKTLADLAPALSRRNALVHGVGQVWIGRSGMWLWHYHFRTNATGQPEDAGAIDSIEAAKMEQMLSSNCRRLGDTLQNLVRDL